MGVDDFIGPANENQAPSFTYLQFPIYTPVFRLAVYSACHLLTCWFLLKFSSTLKMEAICSSEMSVASQQTTRRHIPEDVTLHNHHCENLKSYIGIFLFHFITCVAVTEKFAFMVLRMAI
jgi:hypothetical protein